MKFLCYGTQGWIGERMQRLLSYRAHQVVKGVARCDDYAALAKEIDEVKPDRVFCSVGRTHGTDEKTGRVYGTIDFLELPGNFSLNVRDNLVSPLNVARACRERGVKCAYMGTGCIFEYDAEHRPPSDDAAAPIDCSALKGFTEADKPNFTGSGYSTVKGWTDTEMHRRYDDTVLNWRIRMPIGDESNARDFITKITTYAKVCSIANSMTVLPQLLPIMIDMMEQGVVGTYNMCNPGLITHNQILDLYRQHVDAAFCTVNFSAEEQAKILAAGRSNNYLDTRKLEAYCAKRELRLDTIYDAVETVLFQRGQKKRLADGLAAFTCRNMGHANNVAYFALICLECRRKPLTKCCSKCSDLISLYEHEVARH